MTKAEVKAEAKAEVEAAPGIRTTRTAAQAGAGGSVTILVAFVYEKAFGEPLDVQVAIALGATLTALATWVQNVWERRASLEALTA